MTHTRRCHLTRQRRHPPLLTGQVPCSLGRSPRPTSQGHRCHGDTRVPGHVCGIGLEPRHRAYATPHAGSSHGDRGGSSRRRRKQFSAPLRLCVLITNLGQTSAPLALAACVAAPRAAARLGPLGRRGSTRARPQRRPGAKVSALLGKTSSLERTSTKWQQAQGIRSSQCLLRLTGFSESTRSPRMSTSLMGQGSRVRGNTEEALSRMAKFMASHVKCSACSSMHVGRRPRRRRPDSWQNRL